MMNGICGYSRSAMSYFAGRRPAINSVGQRPTSVNSNPCRATPYYHDGSDARRRRVVPCASDTRQRRAMPYANDTRLSALFNEVFRFVGRCPTLLIIGLCPMLGGNGSRQGFSMLELLRHWHNNHNVGCVLVRGR